MSRGPIFCGVDVGGTSSRACIASLDGRTLGVGRGPGGNPNHYGWEQAGASVLAAVTEACGAANLTKADIDGVFVGAASVLMESDRETLKGIIQGDFTHPGCRIAIDHDIRIALEGGLSGRPGIVLISGTGSSCFGRNSQNNTWQAGGWDQVLDDLGSGYDIAQKAMAASCRAADGRGDRTLLQEILFRALQAKDVCEFAVKVHRPRKARDEIAALASHVFEASVQGDPLAESILKAGAMELAAMVIAVSSRLFPQHAPEIIFSGGLLENSETYRSYVREYILQSLPEAVICPREYPPLIGALFLAAGICGESFNTESRIVLGQQNFL